MPKGLTQEQFESRVRVKLGDSLDLSSFHYNGHRGKGVVTCPTHGQYTVSAGTLLNGHGCEKCYRHRQGDARRKPLSVFLDNARSIHGDKYDYSQVIYSDANSLVSIGCPDHGQFLQTPWAHSKRGSGCPKCSNLVKGDKSRLTQSKFLEMAVASHGDRYGLDLAIYRGMDKSVDILCYDHGVFRPKAGNFIYAGSGCPDCKNQETSERCRISLNEYVEKARAVHGNTFEYSGIAWEKGGAILSIVCPKHGEFKQQALYHLRGGRCEKCSKPVRSLETFKAAADLKHNGKYSYEQSQYTGATNKLVITCPTHGQFLQGPTYHVNMGNGCPQCARVGPSQGQVEVYDFLSGLAETQMNYRLDGRKELDIYVPSQKLGVEFHGLIWHSEKFSTDPTRDYKKHTLAQSKGIRVIHIYQDEWENKRAIVESLLSQAVGVRTHKVFARTTNVVRVDKATALSFLDLNHIQGSVRAPCEHLGLEHDGSLVAIMSFSRVTSLRGSPASDEELELRRFATSMPVVGGASRLLISYLRANPSVSRVISYSENRLFHGQMYEALGFRKDYLSKPSYWYVSSSHSARFHKGGFKRGALVTRPGFSFDPALSERDNCANNGWYRLYDCGKTRWVLDV